jgi:CDP-6-deoxy-D-xylo-4-hexulose-3-dehydrase
MTIPLMRHAFVENELTKSRLAAFILSTDHFSMGEQCAAFERAFTEWQGRKHAVLVNSGSSANLILVQALLNLGRLKAGAKVGFSALTWATNVMPLLQLNLQPIPIDVDPKTLNVMSYSLLERLKETPLDALFITNALGMAGDLDAIRAVCDEYGVLLIEDNCESLGTVLEGGTRTGNFGAASTFSLYVAHHMSAIEGGIVCTDDDTLAEMLIMCRAHGWDRNLTPAQQAAWRTEYEVSEFESKYTFYDLGYNVRPTEITGFLALDQLNYLNDGIHARAALFSRFEASLGDNPDVLRLQHSHIATLSAFCYPVICKTPELRAETMRWFAAADVEVRPLIAGNITHQPFYLKYMKEFYTLPGANFLHRCGFYCAAYPELAEDEIETIEGCLVAKAWA